MPLSPDADVAGRRPRAAPAFLSDEHSQRRFVGELFGDYHEQLVRAIGRRLRCPDALAQDACSHAWLQLWRKPPADESNAYGWLYVVALHEGFRLLRIQSRELIENAAPPGRGELRPLAERIVDPGSPELALEAKQALETLASLKRRQRETLALQVAGYSYREIQAIRRVTYTNVNRHMSEGRAAARRLRDAA